MTTETHLPPIEQLARTLNDIGVLRRVADGDYSAIVSTPPPVARKKPKLHVIEGGKRG